MSDGKIKFRGLVVDFVSFKPLIDNPREFRRVVGIVSMFITLRIESPIDEILTILHSDKRFFDEVSVFNRYLVTERVLEEL